MLTIEDDYKERYDTSFFEDYTDNYIKNPIKKLGKMFQFTNNSMVETIADDYED